MTPAARVLWDASALEQQAVTPSATAKAIAAYVTARDGLNPSQAAAVEHAVERSLTVIWGPPGTGKTKHSRRIPSRSDARGGFARSAAEGASDRANVQGGRRGDAPNSGPSCTGPSGSRGDVSGVLTAVERSEQCQAACRITSHTRPCALDTSDTDYQRCLAELSGGTGVIILGCQIRQARRFPKELMGAFVQPLFDIVIIDESSQVPVSQALSALCGLKNDARLIIAGDHLQMPPITSIDPPSEAAYLVGSIQTYLRERKFSHPVQPLRVRERIIAPMSIASRSREALAIRRHCMLHSQIRRCIC